MAVGYGVVTAISCGFVWYSDWPAIQAAALARAEATQKDTKPRDPAAEPLLGDGAATVQ